jgi:integrase
VQACIANVLNYATAGTLRTGENPASRELVKARLGKLQKDVEHHPALPFADAPAFLAELRERDSTSARALEFTVLTSVRTNETIGATWDEFNLKKKLWIIPAERMKADRQLPVCCF